MAVLIFEGHFLAADDRVLLCEVGRYGPVESNVGEGSLCAPTRRGVYAEHKCFDCFLDGVIIEVIDLYKGRKIGIERGERLRSRPLVLHNTEEVDHLVTERCEMTCG